MKFPVLWLASVSLSVWVGTEKGVRLAWDLMSRLRITLQFGAKAVKTKTKTNPVLFVCNCKQKNLSAASTVIVADWFPKQAESDLTYLIDQKSSDKTILLNSVYIAKYCDLVDQLFASAFVFAK